MVCRGSRKIRLPLHYPVQARYEPSFDAIEAAEAFQASKEFPCPECSPKVPEERVAVLEVGAAISAFHDDNPDYTEAAKRTLAHSVAHELLRGGFIQFHKGPTDKFSMRYELTGRVGVVSTSVVASMEERIAERQTEVAKEVAARAAEEVAVWGSFYTGNEGSITKTQAIDAIERAVKLVFEQRAATPTGGEPQ